MRKQIEIIYNRLSAIEDDLISSRSDIEDVYDEGDEKLSEAKLSNLNNAENHVDQAIDELRVAMNNLKSLL